MSPAILHLHMPNCEAPDQAHLITPNMSAWFEKAVNARPVGSNGVWWSSCWYRGHEEVTPPHNLTLLGGSSSAYVPSFADVLKGSGEARKTFNPSQGATDTSFGTVFMDSLLPPDTTFVMWEFSTNDHLGHQNNRHVSITINDHLGHRNNWQGLGGRVGGRGRGARGQRRRSHSTGHLDEVSSAAYRRQTIELFVRRALHRQPLLRFGFLSLWPENGGLEYPKQDKSFWPELVAALQPFRHRIDAFAVDGLPALEALGMSKEQIFRDRHHPTEEAVAALAGLVARQIRARGTRNASATSHCVSDPPSAPKPVTGAHEMQLTSALVRDEVLSILYVTPSLKPSLVWDNLETHHGTKSRGVPPAEAHQDQELGKALKCRSDRFRAAPIAACGTRASLRHWIARPFGYIGIAAVRTADGWELDAVHADLSLTVSNEASSRVATTLLPPAELPIILSGRQNARKIPYLWWRMGSAQDTYGGTRRQRLRCSSAQVCSVDMCAGNTSASQLLVTGVVYA